MRSSFRVLGPLLFSASMGGAGATSFDCASVDSSVERLICSDATLPGLDEALAQLYQSAVHESAQKKQIRSEQIRWLARRNGCTTTECLSEAYRSRIQWLSEARNVRGELGDWIATWGSNEPMCRALVSRLNRFDGDENANSHCATRVLTSSPDFHSPPWEDVEPSQREVLLAKILKYEGETHESYFAPPRTEPQRSPDSYYQSKAAEMLQQGYRLRVWRTRLVGHYSGSSGVVDAPTTPQAVLQLYLYTSSAAANNNCVGKPAPVVLYDLVQTFIFTPDLADLDARVDVATASILRTSNVLLFKGHPILMGDETVWRDGPTGLDGICKFDFVRRKS